MASSVRKRSYSSISRGSVEKFDHNCIPCISEGQRLEAQAFCVECGEYLCNTCLQCHRKTRASRHHQLLIGKDMDEQTVHITAKRTKVVFEKCALHKEEVLKFYCNQHDILGCSDCITLNHRNCNLDYLPDKCADIDNECSEIMKMLEEKLGAAEAVVKRAEEKDREFDESYKEVMTDISNLRYKIEDKFDIIQKKTKENANETKAKNKLYLQDVRSSCAKITSSMVKLQTSLTENRTKAKNSQLYRNMKKARSTLKSVGIQNSEKLLQDTNTNFTIEGHDDDLLMDFLAQTLGELREKAKDGFIQSPETDPAQTACVKREQATDGLLLSPKTDPAQTSCVKREQATDGLINSPVTDLISNNARNSNDLTKHQTDMEASALQKDDKLNCLKYDRNLCANTETDKEICDIVACAVVSPNNLVLADWNNGKIKLIDLSTNTVTDEVLTGGLPYDIAVLSEEQIAVTVPFEGKIIFVSTSQKLTLCRSSFQNECRGIAYDGNSLYVVCLHPNRINIFDVHGFFQKSILLGFHDLDRITLSPDHTFLYLSNFCKCPYKNEVVRLTKNGKTSKVYRNKKVHGPVGMVAIEDGSLLVCSVNNNTIHLIEPDFKNGRIITNRIQTPAGIAYNAAKKEVYVCQSQSNKLKVFSVQ